MQYINLTDGKKEIAEISGTVIITGTLVSISINPEDKLSAMKVVQALDGTHLSASCLVIPVKYINYMSNNSACTKSSIRLL